MSWDSISSAVTSPLHWVVRCAIAVPMCSATQSEEYALNTNNKDDPAKSLGTRGSLADQLQVVCAALLDELLRNEHVLTLCERWTTEFGYVWTPLPVAPGEGCDVTGDGRLPAIL